MSGHDPAENYHYYHWLRLILQIKMTNRGHLYCHSPMSCPWQTLLTDDDAISKPRSILETFTEPPPGNHYQSVWCWDEISIQPPIKTIYWASVPHLYPCCNSNVLSSIHEWKIETLGIREEILRTHTHTPCSPGLRKAGAHLADSQTMFSAIDPETAP